MDWVHWARRIRYVLAPVGTRREKLYYWLRLVHGVYKQEGLLSTARRVVTKLAALLRGREPSPHSSEPSFSYQQWMRHHEPSPRALTRQARRAGLLARRPLFSILTPVFRPSPEVLGDTIQSVLSQTYPYWELCIANGSPDAPDIVSLLDELASRDSRIRVRHLKANLGIAGNSNEALRISQGDFACLLDHDDLLAPDMIYEVASLLNAHPDTDIVYFDEDKISANGKERQDPWFKPQRWSPTLLLSTNYLMHSVIRRELIAAAGGFDPEMDGAQDWDLAFRLTTRTGRIRHIPGVFYHWRRVEGSVAQHANAKPWAYEAQKRCIEAHLLRRGEQGQVAFPGLGVVRILWPTSGSKVSIIIPTKDKASLLSACLSSILAKTDYRNYEIILVDNGSGDPETKRYYQSLASEARVRLIDYPDEFNYSVANNLGAAHARGDFLLFLNNDTEVLEPWWLAELVGQAQRPEVGVVGAKLLRPDGTIQHAGIIMGLLGHGSHVFDGCRDSHYGVYGSTEWYRDYQAVTGACMMMRREVFEKLGGFDEAYRLGYGDIDLCLRAGDAGYQVVYTPFCRILHHEGATRGFRLPPSDVLRASMRMIDRVRSGDPYFNPNLSYLHRVPAIAHPKAESREMRVAKILRAFGLLRADMAVRFDGTPGTSFERKYRPGAKPDRLRGDRVLVVSHDLNLTGAPMILQKLLLHMKKRGRAVTVLSPADGPLRRGYHEAGIEVAIEPACLDDARVCYTVLQGYAAVLSNTIFSWRSVHAARASKVPCAWWIHESKLGQKFARQNRSVAEALSAAAAVIFPSRATASHYQEFCGSDHFFPIHYGLELSAQSGRKSPFRKRADKLYVVTVGSVEPRKGQDILLQAIQELPEHLREEFEFYLVGPVLDFPFYSKLRRVTRRLKNVHWVGLRSNDEVMAYVQAGDLFVFPSRDEALPIAVLEAMHHGKAIISTNVGGVPEVIEDGVQGLVVDIDDAHAISDGLRRLHEDRDLIRRLGGEARQRFAERITEQRLEDMMALIDRVASSRIERPLAANKGLQGGETPRHSPVEEKTASGTTDGS